MPKMTNKEMTKEINDLKKTVSSLYYMIDSAMGMLGEYIIFNGNSEKFQEYLKEKNLSNETKGVEDENK